jgi:uncharacterized protein
MACHHGLELARFLVLLFSDFSSLSLWKAKMLRRLMGVGLGAGWLALAVAQTSAAPGAKGAPTKPATQAASQAATVAAPPPALAASPSATSAAGALGAMGADVGGFKTIRWDALVPASWDAMKEFRNLDLQGLSDGDPRANEMMTAMRKAWDNAPVNAALVGQSVRIPGFVVPLETGPEGLKEFLLVPYFGACIHSPPPPSNQVIYVLPKTPPKAFRSMDTVWISGTLLKAQTDSFMGAASWRMEAVSVTPYSDGPR